MEGNKIEQAPVSETAPLPIQITLFRHGPAKYEQGNVSFNEAADLTDDGRERVSQQAHKLADSLEADEEITIWSSPAGRTLETASIIASTLKERGFSIRLQSHEDQLSTDEERAVRIFKTFEEVRGLNMELFSVLVDGGTYRLKDGTDFVFEKKKTNPRDLPFGNYYYQTAWKSVRDASDTPAEVKELLNILESEEDVHHRVDRKINRVAEVQSQEKQRLIIVTHHVAIKDYSPEEVEPADFVNL